MAIPSANAQQFCDNINSQRSTKFESTQGHQNTEHLYTSIGVKSHGTIVCMIIEKKLNLFTFDISIFVSFGQRIQSSRIYSCITRCVCGRCERITRSTMVSRSESASYPIKEFPFLSHLASRTRRIDNRGERMLLYETKVIAWI